MTNKKTAPSAKAIIHKPNKSPMQSGKAKSQFWFLEYVPQTKKTVDNLIGWQGSSDMLQEVKLKFETKEHAIAFAEKNNIAYEVREPKPRKTILRSYAENFTA